MRPGKDQLARKHSVWDLAALVLGLNLWISFILLPQLHLNRPPTGTLLLVLIGASPLVLAVGVWLHHQILLLLVFPVLLLLTTLVAPPLVGANVYSFWTFCMVAFSLLAYMLGIPLLLGANDVPPVPKEQHDLPQFPMSPKWRRRMRIYRWMAVLAAAFPLMLLVILHLHPGVELDLRNAYPGRHTEISALFGLLVLSLWLGIFYAYFQKPLRAHVQGDPQMRYELQQLRRHRFRQHPRARFYILVVLALSLMLVLLIMNHW